MALLDAGEIADHVRELTNTTRSLGKNERWDLGVACEAAKRALTSGAQELVGSACGLPMLASKSCDGTPISVVNRSSSKLPSGVVARSHGRAGYEFLVKNQFLRADIPGQGVQTRVMLTEAIRMQHGKTAPTILSASFQD